MIGRKTKAIALASLAGACVLVPASLAQERQEPARPAQRGEADPERLRGLLERRMESLERQQERLHDIMKRLDAGESPAAIFGELRERGELALLGEFSRGGDRLVDRAGDGEREFGRGMRSGPERRPGQEADQPMSPEDFTLWRNRIMAFFEEHAPDMAQRLRESGDSEEARRAVQRLRRDVSRLIELKEQESAEFRPALERLRNGMRIADILGRVRQRAIAGTLDDQTLRSLRQELTAIVEKQFDAEFAGREQFLERTQQRLDNAREKLERERSERGRRIEREVQVMIDRATRGVQGREQSQPQRRGQR